MAAKLPEMFRKPRLPDLTIADMPVGSEHPIRSTALLVDADWSCYLRPDAKIAEEGFFRVRRAADGYHVTVLMFVKLDPDTIQESERAKLIPVASVTPSEHLPVPPAAAPS